MAIGGRYSSEHSNVRTPLYPQRLRSSYHRLGILRRSRRVQAEGGAQMMLALGFAIMAAALGPSAFGSFLPAPRGAQGDQ